jgi:hypothetical protein
VTPFGNLLVVNTNPFEAKPVNETTDRSRGVFGSKLSKRVRFSLRIVVLVIALPIVFLLLISIPAAAGSLDYTRHIPLSEAIAYAAGADWSRIWNDYFSWPRLLFLALASAGLVAFLVCPFRFVPFVVLANASIPVIVSGAISSVWLLIRGWSIIPHVLSSESDGETWSEGVVFAAAAASWSYLWIGMLLTTAVLRFVARRRE